MPKHKFILNDETKRNQYGFRVLNSGLSLERFRKNPVLLDSHRSYGTDGVIGRWENIQLEGHLLTAEAVFNPDDPQANKIEKMVANGFLRGASLGLDPYSMDNFEADFDGYTLTKAEILEASIVPIPNNANAIKLYAASDAGVEQLKEEQVSEILLTASEIKNFKSKANKMKIKLTALAALALALNADQEYEAEEISGKILTLKADLDAANQKIEGLEKLESDKKAKLAADTVEADIKAGRIDATKKADFIKLFIETPDLYKSVVSALPGKQNLAGQINNPQGAGEVKSFDDFEKMTLAAQLEFKETQPEAYAALFKK